MKLGVIEENAAKTASQTADNHQDEIRLRAYEIYEKRGREPGHDLEDWLIAEAEIKTDIDNSVAA